MHHFPRESVFTSFTSPKSFWIPWKGTGAWGPMTRKEWLRGRCIPLGRGSSDQSTSEHLEAGKSASVSSLFFLRGASCPKGGWRGVIGDFLTSTNKSFHCRWPGRTSRPDRPGRWAVTDEEQQCCLQRKLTPSSIKVLQQEEAALLGGKSDHGKGQD